MTHPNEITVKELCAHLLASAPASKVASLDALFHGYFADDGSSLDWPGNEHHFRYGRDVLVSHELEGVRCTMAVRKEQQARILRHAFSILNEEAPLSEGEYYTVRIPYTPRNATAWHPTDATGPFSVLSRGSFATKSEAARWAYEHIPGHEHEIVRCG